MKPQADGGSPLAPSRRRRWRAVVAIAGAVVVAAAAIVVAWGLDRSTAPPPSRLSGIDIEELVRPAPLSETERLAGGGEADDLTSPGAVELERGGWIEVADETGRLRQRYAAERMEPLPDRWMRLDAPRAVFYGVDGRVTRVFGRKGKARIPDREIESGTLEGKVRIEVFRPVEGRPVSVESDDPWLVVLADEVEFDGAEGRLRSDRAVEIVSPELSFSGEGMLLFLDATGRDIERLVVERATSPLRLVDLKRDSSESPEADGSSASSPPAAGGRDSGASPAANASGASSSSSSASPRTPADSPAPPRLFRLALDGGVLVTRIEGDSRSTIEGDRLGAIFSMRSGSLGAIASHGGRVGDAAIARGPASPAFTAPLPPPAWLAASIVASPNQAASSSERPVEIEIEFGGSLVIEPLPAGVPKPSGPREVWVRVEGDPVRVVDPSREAVVHCSVLEARTGLAAGDRLDLLSPGGLTTIDSPSLRVASPSIRVAGRSIDLAGPGWLELGEVPDAAEASAPDDEAPQVRIDWAERLALELGADERSLERATFGGGDRSDGVVVESASLRLAAPSLDAQFFARTPEADRDRLRRVEASGGVEAIRRGSVGRLDAERLVVELQDEPEDAVVERFEATGSVRALDATRVVFADRLAATFLPRGAIPEEPDSVDPSDAALGSAEVDRAEAVGAVVAGLADGTWVFADRLEGDGPAGRMLLAGGEQPIALARDSAVLDGMANLELRDSPAGRRASAPGPGRLRAGSEVALPAWNAPSEVELAAEDWTWPSRPGRPDPAGDMRLVAVWTQGLSFDEPAADESRLDAPKAELVVRGSEESAVRARSVGEDASEDRLSAKELRVRFVRGAREGDAEGSALEPSDLLAIGAPAVLEARRSAATPNESERSVGDPDVFRITGPRIEYGLASREGRVVGAGNLLVSEAPTATSDGATARFTWKGRLDLIRTSPAESLVTLADDVEMIYATRRGDRSAFSVTASRMEAVVREPDERDAPDAAKETAADSSPLGAAELQAVRGFGRVFARGDGRDVECDAFEYDVESGIATLTARPGRSVSVLTRGTPGPVRASAVKWNLRTGRIEVIDGRGEG